MFYLKSNVSNVVEFTKFLNILEEVLRNSANASMFLDSSSSVDFRPAGGAPHGSEDSAQKIEVFNYYLAEVKILKHTTSSLLDQSTTAF